MIPALAFNNRTTLPVHDVVEVRDRLDALMPKTMEFAVLGDRTDFVSKKACLTLGDMTLVALSHTPYQLDRSGCVHPEVWLPLSGRLVSSDGRSRFEYGDRLAYFCTSEVRNIRTTTTSALGLRFDLRRLNAVHAAMIGAPSTQDVSTKTRLFALDAHGVDFLALIKNQLRQIDQLQANAAVLQRLGMEDALYRLTVGMLHPDLLLPRDHHRATPNHAQERISRLCEYLRANLDKPLSLTEMERFSGLSARVLQYNFQKAFGMRPKQWLRKQRLHAARAVLLQSAGRVKLTALAYDFCFPGPSVFSRAYRMEFGELPSATRAGKTMASYF